MSEPFELPTHCIACGVPLMGGLTMHEIDCAILALIRKAFPGYQPPGVMVFEELTREEFARRYPPA